MNVTAVVEPTNTVKNAPAHVGQAIKRPVIAPMLLRPPLFFVMDIAFIASEVFRPTRYDTTTTSTKLIGMICKPTCSVMYTIISGIYPGSPQHAFKCAEGTIAS